MLSDALTNFREPKTNKIMFNFEKLEVWQKAIEFADDVYRITKVFPSDERFGLTNQMRRAAVSISSNIAEGTTRNTRIEYARVVGQFRRDYRAG